MAGAATSTARVDTYHRRLASNLRRHAEACAAVARWGFTDDEIADLGLGLKEPYVRSDTRVVSGVLGYSRSRWSV